MVAAFAGTDISARYFDVCVLLENTEQRQRFDNNLSSIKQSIQWFKSMKIDQLTIAMEPTGRYGELVAERFYREGYRVVQAQPFMFRRYAESLDMRGKSDFKDCFSLAQYAKERGEKLRAWMPKSVLEWELRDIQVLIRSLTKRSVVLQSQIQCGLRSTWVAERLQNELAECQQRLDEAVDRATELIKADEVLSCDFELLMTICGIGAKSAVLLLTLIDFREFSSSRALACFLGLSKRTYESGDSVRGKERLSKRGNGYIRAALFMPARVARIHNPAIAEFSKRLEVKGKHDWAIQMAVIRKLVTTAWSMIVNQVEWSPNYINPQYNPI